MKSHHRCLFYIELSLNFLLSFMRVEICCGYFPPSWPFLDGDTPCPGKQYIIEIAGNKWISKLCSWKETTNKTDVSEIKITKSGMTLIWFVNGMSE